MTEEDLAERNLHSRSRAEATPFRSLVTAAARELRYLHRGKVFGMFRAIRR
jgi:hypothetical protein